MSRIDGRAKKYNGGAIDYVMLFNWSTGSIIGTAKPDASGNWKYYYFSNLNCGITYVANGCEPITHGAYQFNHVDRAPFVDFIGVVTPKNRSTVNADINLVIPATVNAGDMLVVSLMRRSAVSVTDNNSGVWTLGADVFGTPANYEQGASIYYRTAKAGDVGKTVKISTSGSAYFIAYLSIYRGKNKLLKVVNSVSNPLRYDSTYKDMTKNLAPIEHSGGFMVRAVSVLYAVNSPNSMFVIAGMSNVGETAETPSGGQLRLQAAHIHLASADILKGITINTGAAEVNDIIPDVAIILDEV